MVPYYPRSPVPHLVRPSLGIGEYQVAARGHCATYLRLRAWKSFLRRSFAAKGRQCETWILQGKYMSRQIHKYTGVQVVYVYLSTCLPVFLCTRLEARKRNELDPVRLNSLLNGGIS